MAFAEQGDKQAVIVEAGKTYIGKLRATSSERDTLALQLRLSSMLSALNLHPPGLPQAAIVCIRAFRDPLPGALRTRDHDTRPLYAWEQAVQAALKRLVERAVYPAREAIPANADAVIFTDQAEMLACLASDWCAGNISGRWWWQGLFAGKDIERVLVPSWLQTPEYIPAALQRLVTTGKALAFARALGDTNARAMTQSMVRSFGLFELQALLAPFAQQGLPPEPALSAGPKVQAFPPTAYPHAREVRRASIAQDAHAPTAGRASSAPQAAFRQAPWYPWAPEVSAGELSIEQQCLLGTGLMLARAPAVVRSPSFARAMLQWRRFESLASDTGPVNDRQGSQRATARVRPYHGTEGDSPADPRRAMVGAHPRGRPLGTRSHISGNHSQILNNVETTHGSLQKSADLSKPTIVAENTRVIEPSSESAQVPIAGPSSLGQQDAMNRVPSTEEQAPTTGEAEKEGSALLLPVAESPSIKQGKSRTAELLEMEFETELGGIFYLINLGLFLNLYGDFTTPLQAGISLSIWDFMTIIGQQLLGETMQDDPTWAFLARMAGRDEQEPAGGEFDPPRSWRIPPEWLLPFPGEGDWRWNVSKGRLRIQHPERFVVLDVPLDGSDPAEQVRREMQAYADLWHERARLVHGSLRRSSRIRAVVASPPVKRWLRWLTPYIRARLQRASGLTSAHDIPRVLFRHTARITSTATHLDIVLRLATLPIEVRLSGIDRNPGWVPAAGRFVAFHFE